MNEQEQKAWKILVKAQKIGIDVEKEIGKEALDITPTEILSWASTFDHEVLNKFLEEIDVPVWKKKTKGKAVVHIDAYLHSSNEYKWDLLTQLNKQDDEEFRENFGNPLYEVKFTLEVQPNGHAKIVKVDDRPLCEV